MQFTRPWKLTHLLTYHIKSHRSEKERLTCYFAVTLFSLEKTKIKSFLICVFCLTLVHVVLGGEHVGLFLFSFLFFFFFFLLIRVQTRWGKYRACLFCSLIFSISLFFLLGSELAAVIYESSRSAIDGLARWEWHLTAVIPIHRRVIQANSLGFKHLSDWVEVLLLRWVRRAQVAQVSGLVEVPWGQPPLVGMVALLPRV